ncbi:MAG: acyl-CoA dehydrogenase family protein [Pirellulales bacterium]
MTDDDRQIDALTELLRSRADETDRLARWPGDQLRQCAEAGIVRWYVPPEQGGVVKPQAEVLAALARLASGCLTTAFCLTQPTGVAARIAASDNDELKRRVIRSCSTAGLTRPSASRS